VSADPPAGTSGVRRLLYTKGRRPSQAEPSRQLGGNIGPAVSAAFVGFGAQTVLILGLFWQIIRRIDRCATKDDLVVSEKRTTEAIAGLETRTNTQFSEVKEQIGLLGRLVNETRERVILIQGHLGIGITTLPKATPDQPQETPPEKVLAGSGRG